ncbi:hypothetical protein GWO18_00615 [Candidatus Bathyarchaeota archaeon]|nr:hypothetical protein [Candidatus Bathyarchaeota archaeon]
MHPTMDTDQILEIIFKTPASFCRYALGFEPTEYQQDLIEKFRHHQFVAARWCRQSGKSQIIAALLLYYALTHPGCYVAVVGPSWRQTKLIIRRINSFLTRLPRNYTPKHASPTAASSRPTPTAQRPSEDPPSTWCTACLGIRRSPLNHQMH